MDDPRLPQSKPFFKISGIAYWSNTTSILAIQNQSEEVVSRTPIFRGVIFSIKTLLESPSYGLTYGILKMVPKVKHQLTIL